MLLICHKVLVRLLNHFIQQFFWEDTTTSGNTFKLFVDFSGQFQRDGTISTFITPFLLLPGTFQLIKKNRFMLNPGGLEGGLRGDPDGLLRIYARSAV